MTSCCCVPSAPSPVASVPREPDSVSLRDRQIRFARRTHASAGMGDPGTDPPHTRTAHAAHGIGVTDACTQPDMVAADPFTVGRRRICASAGGHHVPSPRISTRQINRISRRPVRSGVAALGEVK